VAIEHDVLIVGGGTAGCVLAARLSADSNRRVLLLEAGRDLRSTAELPPVLVGHPPLSAGDIPDTWRYEVDLVDAPPRRMYQFRGRILGGSSSINGSLFVRGIPDDYDSWSSPLWTYDAVLPYFRKSETDLDVHDEFHGADGPLRVSRGLERELPAGQRHVYERALQMGIPEKADLNHPAGGGIGPVPMTNYSRSTALTYVAPCRDRPNLTLVTEAIVKRVIVEGDRAVGVEVVHDGEKSVIYSREVVLSCGAFGSAELLLRSGIGPAGQLRPLGIRCILDLPGVGQNLGCHPMLTLHFPNDADHAADADGPRLVLVKSTRTLNDVMVFPKHLHDSLTIMTTLRLPYGSGQVRLRSADRGVPLDIRYRYLEPDDLTCLRRGVETSIGLAQRHPLEDPTDAWMLEHLETADHACGTCKLGPGDDPLAVVDDTCRVHGIAGLRVVDLSIVPRPVRAGPYPTVVMLAERAAALIEDNVAHSGLGR
jgi:predicted dehydrogenase (TIGR03970 family)